MQRAREEGLARSIGVSNFGVTDVEAVLATGGEPPVVNQVQFSPFEFRRALQDACNRHDVALEAYSPLGTGRHLRSRDVAGVAERIGRTPAQVLIRWALQHGLIVLPKSTHRERIETNAEVFDFELSREDLATLDNLDTTSGTSRALEHPWW
jgi:2,5-diketo-D-gluconate reductase A